MGEPSNWTPRKVVLFSGHMIDAPGREKPRFPPDKEPIAASAIASGARRARHRGERPLHLRRRLRRRSSVRRSGARARRPARTLYPVRRGDVPCEIGRFRRRRLARPVFCRRRRAATLHVLPLERGATPEGEDPYERNNRWMLDAASRFGPDKVDLVCLWNGEGGDGPGGDAAHDGGGAKSGRPGALARHDEALGLTGTARPVRPTEWEISMPSDLFHDHALWEEADAGRGGQAASRKSISTRCGIALLRRSFRRSATSRCAPIRTRARSSSPR